MTSTDNPTRIRSTRPLVDTVAPVPTRCSRVAIEQFADMVAKKFEFGIGDSMEILVHRLGGNVCHRDHLDAPKDWIPPAIIVETSGRFVVEIPSLTFDARNRLSIAEAVGHFFLHRPTTEKVHSGRPMMATRWVLEDGDPDERRAMFEALWFGFALLMPEGEFLEAAMTMDLTRLSRHFGVPGHSARIRLENLRDRKAVETEKASVDA